MKRNELIKPGQKGTRDLRPQKLLPNDTSQGELSEDDLESVTGGIINVDPEPFPYQLHHDNEPGTIKVTTTL